MPIQTNILEYLEATAPRLPQKLAFSNGTDGVTFSQLHSGAKRLGSALLAMGLRKHPIAVL
ncbi:MAG: D-alanine--poly(phosphoribitol) ligase, partial [Ruminococcaceae bacterium]|nr:D-alanine--poly(phosphoribitol) ligase [Oscillospiraceae bacterium]